MIQQKQVAVAAHQLQHQGALVRIAGATGKTQLNHPFPTALADRHQRQPPQTMLQLQGQGAAIALPGRRGDGMQARGLSQPTQFKPLQALKTAQTQLHTLRCGLLSLLEA